jgi:hypothetical protein
MFSVVVLVIHPSSYVVSVNVALTKHDLLVLFSWSWKNFHIVYTGIWHDFLKKHVVEKLVLIVQMAISHVTYVPE